MPLELDAKQLSEVWEGQSALREDMAKRQDYYDGRHDIVTREDNTYADGTAKTKRVANWVQYIVNRYVGLITSTPYQVTSKEEDADTEGMDSYSAVADANALTAIDVENLRGALIQGIKIELHQFVDSDILIKQHDARNWALIYDESGVLVGAIHRVVLEAGTSRDGTLLDETTDLMWFWNDKTISRFKTIKDAWVEDGKPEEHNYGRVPITVWQINASATSIISDALIGQVDEYNEIFSAAGDDIRRDVDAILAVSGFGAKEWQEALPAIREDKALPLPPDGKAQWLTRNTDVEPVTRHLVRTREIIHMMGEVPDVEQIAGATGVTSGIALKLKFLPMLQAAASMANYLKAGMRDRIELINSRLALLKDPIIEDYRVVIQFELPTNRIEEWKAIQSLNEIVSHKTQLELLSDIGNPEEELLRIEDEAEAGIAMTPEEAVERQEEQVAQIALAVGPAVEAAIEGLTAAVLDNILKSGVIDRTLKRAEAA